MATLKDVAREAKLAVSTVSRILNNRGYISEDARNRVQAAMEKLNYQPNELARSLHRSHSSLIGLIVPSIRHPYFSTVISEIEDAAYQMGYRILLCNSQTMREREQDYIEICRRNRVAGIIMCTGQDSLKEFDNLNVPVIAWERFVDVEVSTIECDNVMGGMIAARHLIDRGCSHLLHIGTNTRPQMPGDRRFDGFRRVCEEAGLACHSEAIAAGWNYIRDFDKDYKEIILDILKKYPETDGIFANNDILACQVIRACREVGRPVPDSIKVVGYDDIYLTGVTSPSITSIRQPVSQMAGTAMEILDSSIQGVSQVRHITCKVTLTEGESTG